MSTREPRQPGGREPAHGPLGLVQSFINTVDLEDGPDHLDRPAGLRTFLTVHGLLGPDQDVSERDRARAVEFREALRELALRNAGEEVPGDAILLFNEFSEAAPLETHAEADGTIELRPIRTGVAGALGAILAAVYESVVDGSWPRLKACHNPDCRWVFYDQSKNRSGRWCTMATCGSRSKARTYARRRGSSTPD